MVLCFISDSILFPDVPIALRLSSHLLLGVVRIYSRKVNYLFNDCSETLLKVKQAFRSTAVDLPPEESTAPYHSITLPETFDLDDFELPDSALLTGYVLSFFSNSVVFHFEKKLFPCSFCVVFLQSLCCVQILSYYQLLKTNCWIVDSDSFITLR